MFGRVTNRAHQGFWPGAVTTEASSTAGAACHDQGLVVVPVRQEAVPQRHYSNAVLVTGDFGPRTNRTLPMYLNTQAKHFRVEVPEAGALVLPLVLALWNLTPDDVVGPGI